MAKVIDLSGNGGGGTGTGWDGQVEFRSALPITLALPPIGSVYLVEKPTTILFGSYTTYQSGLYLKEADTGSLNDWRRLNIKLKFTDGQYRLVNTADESKQVAFSLSGLTTAITRTLTVQDQDGTIALLSDIFNRVNHVLVRVLADLPTPSGGFHQLADQFSYEFNGAITSANYLRGGISNIVYGVDKSNDIFNYTGTGGAIRNVSQNFSLSKVTIIAGTVGGECFTLTGSGITIVELSASIFANSEKVGSITGGIGTGIYKDNLIINCKEGIDITGINKDISIGDNLFDNSAVGSSPTWVNVPSGTVEVLDLTHNLFKVDGGETAINIVEVSVTRTAIVIQQNIIKGAGAGLTGINANDTSMDIPSRSNKGIAGLHDTDETIVLGSWSLTVTTFTQIPETLPIGLFMDKEPNATMGTGGLITSVTHDDNGGTMEVQLYNLTDGIAVVGSTKLITVITANVYQVETVPSVELLENKEYRVRFRRVSGTGGKAAYCRSGVVPLRVF